MQALANPEKCSPLLQIFQVQVGDLVLLEPCLAAQHSSEVQLLQSLSGLSEHFPAQWDLFPSWMFSVPTLESPGAAPLALPTLVPVLCCAVVPMELRFSVTLVA